MEDHDCLVTRQLEEQESPRSLSMGLSPGFGAYFALNWLGVFGCTRSSKTGLNLISRMRCNDRHGASPCGLWEWESPVLVPVTDPG